MDTDAWPFVIASRRNTDGSLDDPEIVVAPEILSSVKGMDTLKSGPVADLEREETPQHSANLMQIVEKGENSQGTPLTLVYRCFHEYDTSDTKQVRPHRGFEGLVLTGTVLGQIQSKQIRISQEDLDEVRQLYRADEFKAGDPVVYSAPLPVSAGDMPQHPLTFVRHKDKVRVLPRVEALSPSRVTIPAPMPTLPHSKIAVPRLSEGERPVEMPLPPQPPRMLPTSWMKILLALSLIAVVLLIILLLITILRSVTNP